MATRVLDQEKVVELLRRYRPTLEIIKVGGGSSSLRLLCPFHTDTNPSFLFTPTTGRGHCFACKKTANFEQVIAALEQITTNEAQKLTTDCYKRVSEQPASRKVKTIDMSMAQLQTWATALTTDSRVSIHINRWGWKREILEKYLIGCSDGRITFPVIEGNDIIGLKYYNPTASGLKYQNAVGSAQACWPLDNLAQDIVYLVEGEKDCVTMMSQGFNAVTFTTGAGGIAKEYIKFFAGKTVYIIYDIDEAGRKGAVNVAKTLSWATKKVHIVELPLTGLPKGDLTDAYCLDPDNFVDYINSLVEHTDVYVAPEATSRVTVPAEIHRTYLEDIVSKRLFYRRVNMKVRIINNAQHETTIVPKDIELTCNKDYKDHLCSTCPAYFNKDVGLNLHIKPEYPELLSMVGNNNKVQRAAIQSMTNVIEGCTKFKVEQKTHQALYPIVAIPAIEADKKNHSYSMVTAWSLDQAGQENEDYDVEGVVLANPETQKLEIVCYRLTKDASSIDAFELSDEMITKLEVFKCVPQHSPKSTTN